MQALIGWGSFDIGGRESAGKGLHANMEDVTRQSKASDLNSSNSKGGKAARRWLSIASRLGVEVDRIRSSVVFIYHSALDGRKS